MLIERKTRSSWAIAALLLLWLRLWWRGAPAETALAWTLTALVARVSWGLWCAHTRAAWSFSQPSFRTSIRYCTPESPVYVRAGYGEMAAWTSARCGRARHLPTLPAGAIKALFADCEVRQFTPRAARGISNS